MLIGEFAREAGLSQDTVRFYVRKGLLSPQFGAKGGRKAYQVFSRSDVATAHMIRFAQSLGMSLREIAVIVAELQKKGLSPEREVELLGDQINRLEQKAAELTHLIEYLRAERTWISNGRKEVEPSPKWDNSYQTT
ncbi:MAG: MerR family transcriptional regulator [Gluconobacter cerinus]|uniref:MerR family transcriptional regulator n=1 Tax=Gluconobacter cerinus TaxID=38307 RepID=UPI0039E844F6